MIRVPFFWCHEDLLRNLICEIDDKKTKKKYEKEKELKSIAKCHDVDMRQIILRVTYQG